MSQAIVFVGPTLPVDEAVRSHRATYRGPAAQGDLLQAARERPAAIGLVDGVFERVPAVWHKEILWALHQGIPVYGSASLGALRAAECAAYGMVGVGRIFEAYRDGVLTDDDEVAVTHSPGAQGYRPTSEAMVNLRATLAVAAQEGVVAPAVRGQLERIAKAMPYPDRTIKAVVALARAEGLSGEAADRLCAWWRGHYVDQKAADARAMLGLMREHAAGGIVPPIPAFAFEHTTWFEDAVQRAAE
jgi:hypothetical protein